MPKTVHDAPEQPEAPEPPKGGKRRNGRKPKPTPRANAPKAKPKAPRPPIDWDAMRSDYEEGGVSIRELARRYDVRSENSIRRKIHQHRWARSADSIVPKLVLEGIARLGDAPEIPIPASHLAPDPQTDVRAHTAAHTSPKNAPPPPEPQGRKSANIEAGDRVLTNAQSIANQHIRAIGEQVKWANGIAETAGLILGNINTILEGPGEDRSGDRWARFSNARAALAMISPDGETLAGLAKAATAMFSGAVKIKRLALAMDGIGQPNPKVPTADTAPGAVREILGKLTPESLMSLRRAAQEIHRLPPPAPTATIDGELVS